MNELTAAKAVEDFLKSELSDYSRFEFKIIETEYYQENDEVFVDADISDKLGDCGRKLLFKVALGEGNPEDCKLEIDMSEDCFYDVRTYDWTVKYFWIALLG